MIVKHMHQNGKVNDKVLTIMTEAYENAITGNKIVISPPERRILFKSVMTQLLNELLSEQK